MDRISALPDELLHVILGFVGDALDVTSTAALSRRWRHVWVYAKNLTFDDSDLHEDAAAAAAPGRQFAGFVDWVLARRAAAAAADMDSLQIRVSRRNGDTAEQASAWLRYAARRVAGSVVLRFDGYGGTLAVDLPAGEFRAASLEIDLSNHALRLPPPDAVARCDALTDLRLFSVCFGEGEEKVVAGGEGRRRRTLGEFVASCCPRLRRLSVVVPSQLPHLVLHAEALEELEVSFAWDLRVLDVTAPNLRAVKVKRCAGDVARIVAPKLEEIFMSSGHRRRPEHLDIQRDCLAGVRRLRGLSLDMHGKYYRGSTYGGPWLMENCPAVEYVYVMLRHGEAGAAGDADEVLVDLTTPEGMAPIVSVTSMFVSPIEIPDRYLVASVSALLTKVPFLRSLRVDIYDTRRGMLWRRCFCDDTYFDKCTIHKKVTLELLEEVKINGFTGEDEEMKLVSMLFESSSSIKRVALRGDTIDRQLMIKIPSTDRGCWSFAKQGLDWTCHDHEPESATLVD